MDITEYLDQECDTKVVFEEEGELGSSVLKFSLGDGTVQIEIRVYPFGIKKLKSLLDLIDFNNLIKE